MLRRHALCAFAAALCIPTLAAADGKPAGFKWTAIAPAEMKKPVQAQGPSPPPPHNMPLLPADAMKPDWLRGPEYPLPGDAKKNYDEALGLVKQGKIEPAREKAKALS